MRTRIDSFRPAFMVKLGHLWWTVWRVNSKSLPNTSRRCCFITLSRTCQTLLNDFKFFLNRTVHIAVKNAHHLSNIAVRKQKSRKAQQQSFLQHQNWTSTLSVRASRSRRTLIAVRASSSSTKTLTISGGTSVNWRNASADTPEMP